MPTYEYRCEVCGLLVPEHREVEQRNDDSQCPDVLCGAVMKRIFIPPAVSFKGSGFHKNDYRKK